MYSISEWVLCFSPSSTVRKVFHSFSSELPIGAPSLFFPTIWLEICDGRSLYFLACADCGVHSPFLHGWDLCRVRKLSVSVVYLMCLTIPELSALVNFGTSCCGILPYFIATFCDGVDEFSGYGVRFCAHYVD